MPHDFSDTAQRALEEAIRVAKYTGARILLLHVALPDRAALASMPETETLKDIAEHPALDGVEVTHTVTFGAPDEQILDSIHTSTVDLVIMGTNGRRGIRSVLVGSIAQIVVRCSPVPVMVLS